MPLGLYQRAGDSVAQAGIVHFGTGKISAADPRAGQVYLRHVAVAHPDALQGQAAEIQVGKVLSVQAYEGNAVSLAGMHELDGIGKFTVGAESLFMDEFSRVPVDRQLIADPFIFNRSAARRVSTRTLG